jgi:hypothetical protein
MVGAVELLLDYSEGVRRVDPTATEADLKAQPAAELKRRQGIMIDVFIFYAVQG